jgi:Holliday junction resolvase
MVLLLGLMGWTYWGLIRARELFLMLTLRGSAVMRLQGCGKSAN